MSEALAAQLCRGEITAAAQALRDGRVSCSALTRAALAEAERAQARLNCFLSIEPAVALAMAAERDAELDVARRHGRAPDSLLFGLPLAHKDMFDRVGQELRYGSKLRVGYRPAGSATVIERLTRAGAVTLGALNMAEFALGATGHNAAHGDCRNAWNPDYVSGGSSSGSGSAVAACATFASLGSDTGGSVRIPASVNGLVGLKPTYGLIPRTGSMKLSPSIDVLGPLARSTRDLAIVLAAVAGADDRDAQVSRRAVPDYLQLLDRGVEGLRLGIPSAYFFDDLDDDVAAALERVRSELQQAGMSVVPVEVPYVEALAELSRAVVYAEATALHASWLREYPQRYTPQVRLRASTGIGIPAPVYLEALQRRIPVLERVVTRVFDRCDVLFAPTLPLVVPRRDATDVGAGEALWPILARLVRCTAPFNYLGLPAISVPAGLDRQGLPIGAQFVGRPFAESVLLRVAAAQEQRLPIGLPRYV